MRIRTVIASLFLLAGTFSLSSAQTANFELAEKFTTQKMGKMTGSTSVFARWIKDKDQFWYNYEDGDGKHWYYVDAARREKSPLFDQEYMAAQLAEIFNRPFNSKDLDLKSFEYDTDKELFTFHVDSIEFTFDVQDRKLVKGDSLEKEKRLPWASYSPDSTWIAFARTHNLYVMRGDDPDSTEIQLTTNGEKWNSYQASDDDTTTTKRLRARVSWFEDGKKFYVKRVDRREVGDLWVINSLKKRPELETYKYAMPGEENVPQEEIIVFDPEERSSVRLNTDKWKDQALGGVYFNRGGIFETKTSDYLYILRRDRTWKHVDVLKADTETGDVQVLWSEESKPYWNTRYAYLGIMNEGEEFVWWSERNGWGQLYRYDANGQLKNKITDGYFVVGDVARIDTLQQAIYFEGFGKEPGVHPYYSQYYKVKMDGTGFKRLTPEDADHSFLMSDKAGYFVDNYSTVDSAPVSVLRNADGNVVMPLESTALTRMEEAGWQMPEVFSVKAADDATDLYGVMWKPFDFDSTKTYPIISYVYPGPQTEPFPTGFSIGGSTGRAVALSQLGFVVVAMGQRGGSPIRSKYYHNYGYGDLRDYPLADNRYALEQLAARHPFIDISRVGIYGHSGGGFMSTAALLSHPDFYDVAVSSAGNHDNNIYNLWWGEVHHGVEEKTRKVKKEKDDEEVIKEEDQEKQEEEGEEEVDEEEKGDDEKQENEMVEETYFESKIDPNAELAGNLEGHLLLVHGDMDNNVHPANTIRLVDALIKAGKRFDFMLLPGQRHGFGKYSPYFERMLWYYFAEHLLGDYRTNVNFNIPEEEE